MSFPSFDSPVSNNGYRWWYVDAVSDDGQNAIAIIIFVGSVFSPYYAWSRKKASTPAQNHCAINVALYGQVNRWCMTERAANSTERTPLSYRIGPSEVRVENNELICDIDEINVPLPSRMIGQVRLGLNQLNSTTFVLDKNNDHHWQPLALNTRIKVAFRKPGINWQGNAYVDSNYGHSPMEKAFNSWNWSRAHLENGDTVVQYDVNRRDNSQECKTLQFSEAGCTELEGISQYKELPKTRYWRIARSTRLQSGAQTQGLQTLEDTPFYSRNRFQTQLTGHNAECIHESINFNRFEKRWVQCLLPFRMPRIKRSSNIKISRESNAAHE